MRLQIATRGRRNRDEGERARVQGLIRVFKTLELCTKLHAENIICWRDNNIEVPKYIHFNK